MAGRGFEGLTICFPLFAAGIMAGSGLGQCNKVILVEIFGRQSSLLCKQSSSVDGAIQYVNEQHSIASVNGATHNIEVTLEYVDGALQ